MTISPIIEAHSLHRSIEMKTNTLHILCGLNFHVFPGEWVALTGPSGSGKSTLLGILGGIDHPTSGKIIFNGHEIGGLSEAKLTKVRNQSIGIVFQNFNLIPTMSALENIEIPLYVSPKARESKQLAQQVLAQVGLSDRKDHRPHQLSGGEQQRVAIARALVTQPKLLLADEPTGNLDTKTGETILQLLNQIRKQFQITIIMVTHDPTVAAYADRVLHLVDGRIVSDKQGKASGTHV